MHSERIRLLDGTDRPLAAHEIAAFQGRLHGALLRPGAPE